MAANRQFILIQTFFAGVATFATLALFHAAHPDDTKTVGTSMNLVDRSFAADGDDDEAQLQQQLQIQQEIQQSEQQAEQQEQLDLQEAQQAEQQGQQVEQQATLSVPGN
ncbi:hypothetical protein A5712_29265 [Mycobacterium sp. E2327]|uniref:hypothetical protein n=1 Tax=Mycobacterium sp. E2327 TaxID=1834132 RepID=UPI000801BE44|nr:hypothetical protein [Mycobacterium sp. E2327]OBI15086.1 hypothetical protein A5712_29265 [Mycobacterium sp. E2327]